MKPFKLRKIKYRKWWRYSSVTNTELCTQSGFSSWPLSFFCAAALSVWLQPSLQPQIPTRLDHFSYELLSTWQRQRVYGLLTVTKFGADVTGGSRCLQTTNQIAIVLVFFNCFCFRAAVTLHFYFSCRIFRWWGHTGRCLEHLSVRSLCWTWPIGLHFRSVTS